ncbi:MAG: alpha-L-rhamnosidase C-terminal domain-containing protein [bacterium]
MDTGIQSDPAEPGFAHVIINPYFDIADIKWVQASIDIQRGRILTQWKLKGEDIYLTATIPANTRATVKLPEKPEGYNSYVIEVGSGSYKFCLKGHVYTI